MVDFWCICMYWYMGLIEEFVYLELYISPPYPVKCPVEEGE